MSSVPHQPIAYHVAYRVSENLEPNVILGCHHPRYRPVYRSTDAQPTGKLLGRYALVPPPERLRMTIAANLFASRQQVAQAQTAAILAAGHADLVAPCQRQQQKPSVLERNVYRTM